MRLSIPSLLNIAAVACLVGHQNIGAFGRNVYDNNELIEAGCKYDSCADMCDAPRWIGYGTLLQKGACISATYSQSVPPDTNGTKIYSTIEGHVIRDIDAKKKTLTIDFSLKLRWMDAGINTNFSTIKEGMPGIALNTLRFPSIWMPDVYVYNLSSYKSFKDSMQWKSFLLVQETEGLKAPFEIMAPFNGAERNITQEDYTIQFQGLVVLTLEATATIYCNFDLPSYPFDNQNCQFRLGGRSFGSDFTAYNPENKYHKDISYHTSNFFTTTTFINDENGTIGFDIFMSRDIQSYVLKYYITCIAIVILSHFSFVIPLSDVSGRVALLVTLFLTLTNLFIYQLVSAMKLYSTMTLKVQTLRWQIIVG